MITLLEVNQSTMKRYTQNQICERYELNRGTKSNPEQENPRATQGSEAPQGRFLVAGLTEVHVLTTQSPLDQRHSDFLDISFKEWEKWLNDLELRQSQRAYKYRHPYTPIEWQKS